MEGRFTGDEKSPRVVLTTCEETISQENRYCVKTIRDGEKLVAEIDLVKAKR